jgi:hypothetical protein
MTMLNEASSPVTPFARYLGNYTEVCGGSDVTHCIPLGGGSGTDHCVSVLSDGLVKSQLPADSAGPPITRLGNTFADISEKVVVGSCAGQYGFKSAQATKNWHGAYPFTCNPITGVYVQYPAKFWNGASYDIPDFSLVLPYDAAKSYAIGDYCYTLDGVGSPVGYKAIAATTGHSPSDTAYWIAGTPNRSNIKYLTRSMTVSTCEANFYSAHSPVVWNGRDPLRVTYTSTASPMSRSVVDRNTGEIRISGYPVQTFYPVSGTYTYQAYEFLTNLIPYTVGVWTLLDDTGGMPHGISNLRGVEFGISLGSIGNPRRTAGALYAPWPSPSNVSYGDTLTVAGVVYTFGSQITIGASNGESAANFFDYISAHPHPKVYVGTTTEFGSTAALLRRPGVTADIVLSSSTPNLYFFGESIPPLEYVSGWSWSNVYLSESLPGKYEVSCDVSRSDAVYSWDVSTVWYPPYLGVLSTSRAYDFSYSGNITLSDPYYIGGAEDATDPNVLRDAASLAQEWHLWDKAQEAGDVRYLEHPIRSDYHNFEAALVALDERSSTSPETGQGYGWNYAVGSASHTTQAYCQSPDYHTPVNDSSGNTPWSSGWTPTFGWRNWFDTDFWAWNGPTPPTSSGAAAALALVSTGNYTGHVLGKPLPAGYGVSSGGSHRGSFDPFFWRWKRSKCTVDGAELCEVSNLTTGMWTPDFLPANCQRWTPQTLFVGYSDWTYMYPCSFVKANGNGIYLQKMVETLIPKPSYDFTRPHRADRFTLIQPTDPTALTKIYYVSGVAVVGLTLVVTLINRNGTNPSDVSPDFTAGDIVCVPSMTGDNTTPISAPGFYPVLSVSGATVTVDTLKWKIPTGFTNDSGDETRAFGKVRFPTAPGFSGQLYASIVAPTAYAAGTTYPIAAAVTSGGINYVSLQTGNTGHTPASSPTWWRAGTCLTYAASPYIQTGDLIDLYTGTTWDDNSGAGYALTRLDDTHCSVVATPATMQYIVPHAYAVIDPATSLPLKGQEWYFADSRSKGDFVARQWRINMDTSAQEPGTIVATQHCLPMSKPCAMRMAGFSPQYYHVASSTYVDPTNELSTNFGNGLIDAFPLTVNNGNVWLGETEQWMVDPLWKAPHKPFVPVEYSVPDSAWVNADDFTYAKVIWGMDDGSCLIDHDGNPAFGELAGYWYAYYRMPDCFESRITVPNTYGTDHNKTAPALPESISLAADQSPPNTGEMPGCGSDAFWFDQRMPGVVKPWNTYANQQGCVCATGRFYAEYKANYVKC